MHRLESACTGFLRAENEAHLAKLENLGLGLRVYQQIIQSLVALLAKQPKISRKSLKRVEDETRRLSALCAGCKRTCHEISGV